jgi:hypothetical protein
MCLGQALADSSHKVERIAAIKPGDILFITAYTGIPATPYPQTVIVKEVTNLFIKCHLATETSRTIYLLPLDWNGITHINTESV